MFLSLRYRKLRSPIMSFFLLALLSMGYGRRILERDVEGVRSEGKPSSPSTGYFSQTSTMKDKEEDDDLDPLYGVSKRFVPQGPNPLHN